MPGYMKMTLGTRNIRALQANFVSRDRTAQREIRRHVKSHSEQLWEEAFVACPKDTWFMSVSLRHYISDGGLTFDVGWRESDFTEAGFVFYPLYVIFGTRFQLPNDFFFPLRDRRYALLSADIRESMSRALARRL